MVCLEDQAACFGFGTTSTSSTCALSDALNGGYWTNDDWSSTSPDITDINIYVLGTSTAAFGYGFAKGWFAAPSIYDSSITSEVNFVNFQRINDVYKIEIDDTDTAWSLSSADSDDYEDTAVTFAGSITFGVSAVVSLAALSIF